MKVKIKKNQPSFKTKSILIWQEIDR